MDFTVYVAGEGKTPTRATEGDAGFDLYCTKVAHIEPGTFVDIDCGVSVELPAGVFGLLTGRSSTLRRRGLLVAQGVIDTGYRGPLFAGVWNLTQRLVTVEEGERLAQLLLLPNLADHATMVHIEGPLAPSVRGDGGFGSTGR